LTKEAFQRVLVITGTTSSRKLSTDVALAAKSTATVVILMEMSWMRLSLYFKMNPKEKCP
jgi:uroporphyrin-III C-methyltransferase